MPSLRQFFPAILIALALAACVRPASPGPGPASPPRAGSAATITPGPRDAAEQLQVRPGAAVEALNIAPGDAAGALAAFVRSCPRLLANIDATGLTRGSDWQASCAAAVSARDPLGFFTANFETLERQGGSAFVTGYFEPEIAGVRTRRPGFDVPVYGLPPDLVRAWPAETPAEQRTGRPPLGRYDASGAFMPYFDRAEIEDGALAGRGLEIAWAADAIDFFFLQIQGSGRLRAPDGAVMRIGYAGQNGRDYIAIGALLRQRGVFEPGQASMQGIVDWLRANPEEGRELMRQNKSWVFFRELTGPDAAIGPLGALSVPVVAGDSVAADPAFTPLGAPVWLALDRPEANGLWIAQDTGGAIKGANRFDTFWGAGENAKQIAGGMAARGRALILVPRGTLARLRASPPR